MMCPWLLSAGEVVGLLGPNGAGKTTIVAMIAGLIVPTAGEVLVDGAPLVGDTDPKKRRIGLVPAGPGAVRRVVRGRRILRFFGAL